MQPDSVPGSNKIVIKNNQWPESPIAGKAHNGFAAFVFHPVSRMCLVDFDHPNLPLTSDSVTQRLHYGIGEIIAEEGTFKWYSFMDEPFELDVLLAWFLK
jgi:hypothetical protein